MRMRTHALTAIGLLLLASLPAHAQTVIRKESPQGYIEVYEDATINWSEGMLTATGVGLIPRDEPNRARAYLKARGYARLDALANLLMLIDRVQIDAQYTGADYMMQSEVLRASITGFVRGAQVIDERKIIIEGQEAVQVTVGTAMYGTERAEPHAAASIRLRSLRPPRLSRRCRASSCSGRTSLRLTRLWWRATTRDSSSTRGG
jgi:hypothetical protein